MARSDCPSSCVCSQTQRNSQVFHLKLRFYSASNFNSTFLSRDLKPSNIFVTEGLNIKIGVSCLFFIDLDYSYN